MLFRSGGTRDTLGGVSERWVIVSDCAVLMTAKLEG